MTVLPIEVRMPWFLFPWNVNEYNIRVTSFQVMVLSILGIVFRDERPMHWIIMGLAIDFALRIVFGGRGSPLGTFAEVITCRFKRKLLPGPPKQFAAVWGFTFSTLACIFFFVLDTSIPSACLLGVQAAFAFLEAFFNFCAGCFAFSRLIYWGWFQPRSVEKCNNVLEEMEHAIEEEDRRLNEGPPDVLIYSIREGRTIQADHLGRVPTKTVPVVTHGDLELGDMATEAATEEEMKGEKAEFGPLDLKVKCKTDDMRREDFHIIRHMKVNFFGACMGVVGLAATWKFAHMIIGQPDFIHGAVHGGQEIPKGLWYMWTFIGLAMFAIFLVLYTLRWILYPKKCLKEYDHPIMSNMIGTIPVTILLFAFLVRGEGDGEDERERWNDLSKALFWIGAPLMMLTGIVFVSRWIKEPKGEGQLSPAWMIPIVGNLVAALVAPFISRDYREAAWLWFSYAFLMYIALFTITLRRTFFMLWPRDKIRSTLAIWVASPFVSFVAYIVISGGVDNLAVEGRRWVDEADFPVPNAETEGSEFPGFHDPYRYGYATGLLAVGKLDSFARWCYFTGLFQSCIILWLEKRNWFGRNKWDMAYWGYTFPADALAFATVTYHRFISTNLTYGMSIAFLVLATALVVVNFFLMFSAILKRHVFTPDEKWGPLSFNKLIHNTLRDGALPKLQRMIRRLDASEARVRTIRNFATLFEQIAVVVEEHFKHEEEVLYRYYEGIFPGFTKGYPGDHAHIRALVDQIKEDLAALEHLLEGEERTGVVKRIQTTAKEFIKAKQENIKKEDLNLHSLSCKFTPFKMQRHLVRRCWDATALERWETIFSAVLEHALLYKERIRFIKCFEWSYPWMMQTHFGRIVYKVASPENWERIIMDLPELIPRNVSGWIRFY